MFLFGIVVDVAVDGSSSFCCCLFICLLMLVQQKFKWTTPSSLSSPLHTFDVHNKHVSTVQSNPIQSESCLLFYFIVALFFIHTVFVAECMVVIAFIKNLRAIIFPRYNKCAHLTEGFFIDCIHYSTIACS